jgi:hypothetical protein
MTTAKQSKPATVLFASPIGEGERTKVRGSRPSRASFSNKPSPPLSLTKGEATHSGPASSSYLIAPNHN